jgi:hypothetical protein
MKTIAVRLSVVAFATLFVLQFFVGSSPGQSVGTPLTQAEAANIWGACVGDAGYPLVGCGTPCVLCYGWGTNSGWAYEGNGNDRVASTPCGCSGTYTNFLGLCTGGG